MTAYGQRIGAAARGFGQKLPLKETATTLGTAMGDNTPSVIIERERERETWNHTESTRRGGMLPFDRELGETLAIGHGGGVMQVNDADLAAMRYIVRRLTPVECERLMGLPDGWTIPAFRHDEITDTLVSEFVEIHNTFNRIMAEYGAKQSGEPDSNLDNPPKPPKPKTANQVRKWLEKIANRETCPDAPRYKACGNGWATNQPRWILLRLIHEDRKAK